MGRAYTVTAENITWTNTGGDTDLIALTLADDVPVRIRGFEIDNVGGAADAGDAQEEFLRLSIVRGHTSVGSGGAAVTPRPVDPKEQAASFTARANDTTLTSSGTGVTVWGGGFSTRVTGPIFFPDDLAPRATQGDTTIVLRGLSTPADDISITVTMWVEEA